MRETVETPVYALKLQASAGKMGGAVYTSVAPVLQQYKLFKIVADALLKKTHIEAQTERKILHGQVLLGS